MAAASEQTTTICCHCDRVIPSSNIELHYVHCSRNLEKCEACGDMIPILHAKEHFINTHAPVACSFCNETIERQILAVHKGENCLQRIITCEYCELPLPAVDLFEHQDVCGNRTELCHLCRRYIKLCERNSHENKCTSYSDNAESSRSARPAEDNPSPTRRSPHEFKKGLLTIAITGVAVLLATLIFQRKNEQGQTRKY